MGIMLKKEQEADAIMLKIATVYDLDSNMAIRVKKSLFKLSLVEVSCLRIMIDTTLWHYTTGGLKEV